MLIFMEGISLYNGQSRILVSFPSLIRASVDFRRSDMMNLTRLRQTDFKGLSSGIPLG